MIAHVAPANRSCEQSLNSLRYAERLRATAARAAHKPPPAAARPPASPASSVAANGAAGAAGAAAAAIPRAKHEAAVGVLRDLLHCACDAIQRRRAQFDHDQC